MANKYMKICLASLAIRKIQIKIIMLYHLIPIRIAIIKKDRTIIDAGEGAKKGKLLHMVDGN